jgi:hypothetical protein
MIVWRLDAGVYSKGYGYTVAQPDAVVLFNFIINGRLTRLRINKSSCCIVRHIQTSTNSVFDNMNYTSEIEIINCAKQYVFHFDKCIHSYIAKPTFYASLSATRRAPLSTLPRPTKSLLHNGHFLSPLDANHFVKQSMWKACLQVLHSLLGSFPSSLTKL